MDPGTAAVTGAAIGALSATLGTVLNSWMKVRLERLRWPKERELALAASYRDTVQALATHIASALHSMCWLTWPADRQASAITDERIAAYDAEMHKLLPQITGSLAAVAVLDPPTQEKFQDIAEALYTLDSKIGDACLRLTKNREKALETLTQCWKEALQMDKELPPKIAGVITLRLDQRATQVVNAVTQQWQPRA